MTVIWRKGEEVKQRARTVLWIVSSLLLVSGLFFVVGASLCEEVEDEKLAMAGGLMGAPKDVENIENSVEIDEIGKYAVTEHNTKEGKSLVFKKVVSAKKQVVSGTMYHLTLEATQGGSDQPKVYDAKVWHKPWESHKSLEQFKESEGSHSNVSCDTEEQSGLREVSVEDPVIKEAAEHAVKGLNKKSNSLVPYELKKVLSAKAEASDEETQVELVFKVSRSTKDEDVKSRLQRTAAGKWTVNFVSTI